MKKTFLIHLFAVICKMIFGQSAEDNQISFFSAERANSAISEQNIEADYYLPGRNTANLLLNNSVLEKSISFIDTSPFSTNTHTIIIPQGWSGLSSFVVPYDPDVVNLFLPVQDKLVILYNQQGVYFPSQGINTLGNWDSQSGYIAKFTQDTILFFNGEINLSGTLILHTGWNLIPVVSFCPVKTGDLFEGLDIELVKEVAGYDLFWPDMGIYSLDELIPGYAYYVLMNSDGEISFPDCFSSSPWTCGLPVIDARDGKSYNTIEIDDLCWMAENLNYGTRINGIINQTNDGVVEKYCYNDLETNCDVHGGLYQWNELMNYGYINGIQGICPNGWHIATDMEWYFMTSFLDPAITDPNFQGWTGNDIGLKLIPGGSSGFNALYSGERQWNNGSFIQLDNMGFFWTSTINPYNASQSWYRRIEYDITQLVRNAAEKDYGLSVRCVKDVNPSSWQCGEPITDPRDDRQYTTALIDNQCWMSQNLNFGTRIDGIINQTNNEIAEKYCYNNLEINCDIHGGLYQWDELMTYKTSIGSKGLCQAGWHIATDREWFEMTSYLDPTITNPNISGWIGTDIGFRIIQGGSSGFEALFSGERKWDNGSFIQLGNMGFFWASTTNPNNPPHAWYRRVEINIPQMVRDGASKNYGLSVRCIKN